LAPLVARSHDALALLAYAFPAAAIAALFGGFWPNLAVLVGGVAVVAVAFQVLKTLVDALVGRAAADRVRGRVFAVYDVLYNVAFVVAGLALIPLWQLGRERALLWLLAAAFVAGGVLVARLTRAWPFDRSPDAGGRRRPRHAWKGRAAALLCGALPVLAFPAPRWWWIAWFALVPLLVVLRGASTRREASWRGWWGGTGFILTMHHWLIPNVGPFILPLAAFLGLLWLPWGALVWTLVAPPASARRMLGAIGLVPAGWIVIEAVRSWSALGGPWGVLGASQWNFRPTLALAALGGVWLVSFAVVAVNVAVFVAIMAPTGRARVLAAGIAVVVFALGPGWYAAQPALSVSRSVHVAIVQPGVVKGRPTRLDVGERLTRTAAGKSVGLVIWGESSFGYDLGRRPDLLARLERVSRAVGADLLVNVDARRAGGGIYKTSVLVTPHGIAGRYDKMRLVPFGEYIPLRFALGWTARITEAAEENRYRGKRLVLLDANGVRIGPLVCFESAFPDMSRNLANRGADLIVVQSSTATFQGSWAPAQHASLAAVRAVESGRPVVHATLTGDSVVFDARGRELARLDTHHRGVLDVTIPLAHTTTVFDRLGDWVVAVSFGVFLAAAIAVGVRRARRR
jgi:apolipoprotein N-acyltransferase